MTLIGVDVDRTYKHTIIVQSLLLSSSDFSSGSPVVKPLSHDYRSESLIPIASSETKVLEVRQRPGAKNIKKIYSRSLQAFIISKKECLSLASLSRLRIFQ